MNELHKKTGLKINYFKLRIFEAIFTLNPKIPKGA